MLAKILLFMIVFFIVANPATFKLMRQVLGGWVATAEGVAKPGGLLLHSLVFVLLAVAVPRALMRRSYYAEHDGEEYEEDEYEEEYEEDEYADEEEYRRRRARKMRRAPPPPPVEEEPAAVEEYITGATLR